MHREAIESRARSEIDRLLSAGGVRPDDLLPCSDQDILALEEAHRVALPEAYKVFLRRMGRGAGRFLKEDHWFAFYDSLTRLNRSLRENLTGVSLPPDSFCFATRMGEVYLFFAADGRSDDPHIQYWNEETDPNVETGPASFWDWFDEMVSDFTRNSA